MLKRFWNYITDYEEAASGLVVVSSIAVACASLAFAMIA